MKTPLFATALASALLFQPGTAASQPPRLDPATGMPEAPAGQPSARGAGQPMPGSAAEEPATTANAVHELVANGLYAEALQRCVSFHEQHKTGTALIPLLADWVELGRRYPEAKAALIKIRDAEVREFGAGRGYFDLFSEVSVINSALQQENATYTLFTSFRDQDPELAQQCFGLVEGLLVARGEYQWCYDHLGDPQEKFDLLRQSLTRQLDFQKRMAAMNAANQQRLAETLRQHGGANAPAFSPPDHSTVMKRAAENYFVTQTRQLIEILVATGHQKNAEAIRAQAVKDLDDERLKSAVSDAEEKIHKLSTPTNSGSLNPKNL